MRKILLALLSGFLLAFSWPEIGLFPISFFAFLPLFILEDKIQESSVSKKGIRVFLYCFLAFFIFNVITTYWVYHATIFGAIMAFIVNAILMSLAFWLFHKVKGSTTKRLGYFSFIFLWISMEYIHLNWDLSWPWLTLGNVFADSPSIVQWYEFTGFLGGSLWILLSNILLFRIYQKEVKKKELVFLLLVLFFPIIFSYNMYLDYDDTNDESINVLLVQPNVDPYKDKFSVSFEKQLEDFITLAETGLAQEIELLIGPETALTEGIWENQYNRYENTHSIIRLKELQAKYPNLNILVGATTYKLFSYNEKKSSTARRVRNENIFYDAYNSAIFLSSNGDVKIYHKTKLVPGVEKMPFPYILDPLAKLAVNLGGTSGSLGSSNTLINFDLQGLKIKPLICYESVYGEMDFQFSNLIAIITNDGWWKDTHGYKQHFTYAKLRAIEQRKSIVRSANTGVSGVISARGDLLQKSKWDEAICLRSKIKTNNIITFYSKFGDYIGRISLFIAIMLLMVVFIKEKVKY